MTEPTQTARDCIIVALDVNNPQQALEIAQSLDGHVGAFKLGLEFMTSVLATLATSDAHSLNAKWNALAKLFELLNGRIMWDGKFNDIPNTMAGAVRGFGPVHPRFFTVHASAGIPGMLEAAKFRGSSKMLAVTVLTSFAEDEAFLTFGAPSKAKVLQFARNAALAGADGIVCSPQELAILAKQPELTKLIKVIPGIRPAGSETADQKRVMTPGEAMKLMADYLVIGRPITGASDPVSAAKAIADEIAQALQETGR
ncbi:orotidine-5'-phosphate decarboxylase [Candidatus Uhrbacteria bacterium]|nr:orotidine-5'-phosphate decarboxylase [Candidatus Uhrbacteria bacterium]